MTGSPRKRERERPDVVRWRDDPTLSSRPPFVLRNRAAEKSGAWSADLVAETMEELRPRLQWLIDRAPWVQPIDVDALEDYLRDRARLERLERWLAEHGDRYPATHKRAGELRDRDLREISTLRRRCMDARATLGLTPLARVRMALDRTFALDVAQLMADMVDDGDGGDEAAS